MNKNRIYWKKGLDITPEIFIDADTHYLHRLNTINSLTTRLVYGILDSDFRVKAEIKDNFIYFEELICRAVTPAGYLIETDKNMKPDRVPLQGLIGREYYIALKTIPYLLEAIPGNDPYSRPGYYLELLDKGQEINDGIPVLKITGNPKRRGWEIVPDYIPPTVSVRLHGKLLTKLTAIRRKLQKITGKLQEDNLTLLQIKLLTLELTNLPYEESPYKFVILLKKICLVLQIHIENMFEASDFFHFKAFIAERYNHNDVASILNLGLMCLEEMDRKTVIKNRIPLPPPPPPPTPPPPPAPENLPKI